MLVQIIVKVKRMKQQKAANFLMIQVQLVQVNLEQTIPNIADY